MNPFDLFLSRIHGFRSVPAKLGFERAGRCFCPAHQHNPGTSSGRSLSVAEGLPGVLVIHCHAGCSPAEIIGAVGLEMSDLFPRISDPHHHGKAIAASAWHSAAAAADGIEDLSFNMLFSRSPNELFENQMMLADAVREFKMLARQAMKAGV